MNRPSLSVPRPLWALVDRMPSGLPTLMLIGASIYLGWQLHGWWIE